MSSGDRRLTLGPWRLFGDIPELREQWSEGEPCLVELELRGLGCELGGARFELGVYRGGRRPEDLYARVYAGIYASTMPDSKAKAGPPTADKPDAIWDTVHFLQALADPRERMLLQQFDPTVRIE